ncbi:MAG: LysM peptidoglycan-binding domain-containing protein [Sporichthyaceae bacterium]|nr:LysM peptidoglycan-binding domain-containing protein [Sporichthyaceae bacterium]
MKRPQPTAPRPQRPVRPPRRTGAAIIRIARGAGAATVLAAILVAAPVLLALLIGWPLPSRVPTGAEVVSVLREPVSWTGVVKALACVTWLAWAQFTACVLVEAWAQLSRSRIPAVQLPLSGPMQSVARKLVVAVILAFVTSGLTPAIASARTVPQATVAAPIVELAGESVAGPLAGGWPEGPRADLDSRGAKAVPRGGTATDAEQGMAAATKLGPLKRYVVQDGDNLWDIAAEYLGDGMRYQEIYRLNAGVEQPDGRELRDCAVIEPSWVLRMPADAKRLPVLHAPAAEAADQGPTGQPAQAQPQPTAEPAGTVDSTADATAEPVADLPTLPVAAPAPADPADAGDQQSIVPLPLLFAGIGVGLAATCLLGALDRLRRRQQRLRRPAHRITRGTAAAGKVERALRAHDAPVRAAFLDHALRTLAGSVAGWSGSALPDVLAARLSDTSLELRLFKPAGKAPAPFAGDARSSSWTVDPTDLLAHSSSEHAQSPAPLPALVSVAGKDGESELIDLERLGSLGLTGDRTKTLDLLRYLATELAHSVWSDHLQVTLVGFGEELVALNPERLNYAESLGAVIPVLESKLDTTTAALSALGDQDLLAARINARTDDALTLHVVLTTKGPDLDETERFGQLLRRIRAVGRSGLGIVVGDGMTATTWTAHLGADGIVTIGALRIRAEANGIPDTVVPGLVQLVETARSAVDEAVLAEAEPTAWWSVPLGEVAAEPPAGPTPVTARTSRRHAGAAERAVVVTSLDLPPDPDVHLDADLEAWRGAPPNRPTVGVLGPVKVFGLGHPPNTRFAWYAEVATFLAVHPTRRVSAEQLTHALWGEQPTEPVSRRETIATVRQWLGTDSAGEPYLGHLTEHREYPLDHRVLLDWSLFERLCARARRRDPRERILDLQAALELVRGRPFDGIPPARYAWLAETGIVSAMESAIVDAAHALADAALDVQDTTLARWAARRGQLADDRHSSDLPYGDLMRAAHADGDWDELRDAVRELLALRSAAVEDLNPETWQLIDRLVPGATQRTLSQPPPEARTA